MNLRAIASTKMIITFNNCNQVLELGLDLYIYTLDILTLARIMDILQRQV